jgi:hypothetical protein
MPTDDNTSNLTKHYVTVEETITTRYMVYASSADDARENYEVNYESEETEHGDIVIVSITDSVTQ